MIRAVVAGAGGKMGARILAALAAEKDFEIAGNAGRSAPIEKALSGGADVVIDFSTPEASVHNARVCGEKGVPLVIGTTGFSSGQRTEIGSAARRIPLLLAPNMSMGVNVLFGLVADAARALGPACQLDILEIHHRAKKDAPSGTALRLAEAAAGALGVDPASVPVQSIRGGDVVGEHTVFFLADGERLELTHKATSRDNFARGAVRAARWLCGKKPGLYDMQDVLGLKR